MAGYLDMPDATAETIDPEGWVHTGDLGTMDERGFVRVTGRIKDMIIRGGENIYPREIEAALAEHPGVLGALVVGLPSPEWGEIVAAVVKVADDGEAPTAADLHDTCAPGWPPTRRRSSGTAPRSSRPTPWASCRSSASRTPSWREK
jgi:acyl-CoA synthetase (AMP-forming)/AMP-acid ligase II